jgi:XTP/dITP diphosphohydrolase
LKSGKQVVLASGNAGKLREIGAMVAHLDMELIPQSVYGVTEAEETGLTFVENAIIKARHASEQAGLPAIADDSGIEVDCLDGAPGVYSARYAGAGASDEDNLNLLVEHAFAADGNKPAARFQCLMVYLAHDRDATPVIAQGTWEGYLVQTPRGRNGFGYDPVFFVPEHQCTSAELPPEVKNRISHRALALQELLQKMTDWISRHTQRP